MKIDFSAISSRYEEYSKLQKSSGEILLNMLNIGENEDVLDLGCGVGNLTKKIRELTKGKVVGIDISEGMIEKAKNNCKGLNIIFEVKSAEEMDYLNEFDVIFCDSSFQWFKEPEKVVKNCYNALKDVGRMGVQCPAKKIYSPNFIKAVEKVNEHPETREIFKHFRNPWFFMDTEEDYKNLFESAGFKVVYCKIHEIRTKHNPEDMFRIFSSGAIAGYLNQDYYDVEIDEHYIEKFKEIVKKEFYRQSRDGVVELIFNRLFLIAVKE